MTLLNLRPMLRTWHLTESIRFYEEILGFECRERRDDYGWAWLERDGIAIMLSGPNVHEGDQKPLFTGSLYFTCDNVDEIWKNVSRKVKVCYELKTFDYGMREFGIYDNNGYLLQFGTPVEQSHHSP